MDQSLTMWPLVYVRISFLFENRRLQECEFG